MNDQDHPTLADLSAGERGECKSVSPSSPLCGRLRDLGLRAGTEVVCEAVSLCGDPCAYRIAGQTGGSVIALRRADARAVRIRRTEGKGTAWD